MRGDLHLHDLGFIDRPYCSGQSVEYVKKFGLDLPNALSIAKPAKHPEVLLAQMVKFSAALQGVFAGAIGRLAQWGHQVEVEIGNGSVIAAFAATA